MGCTPSLRRKAMPAGNGSGSVVEGTGAEILAESLCHAGIETIFGLSGDTGVAFYDALYHRRHSIRHGPTRRPAGPGTRLPGASCAAGRGPDPAPRCAPACRAAPPCGLGTRHPPGIYPPGPASASSRNPRSFTSSWPIALVPWYRSAVTRLLLLAFSELSLLRVLGSSGQNAQISSVNSREWP